jgi:hypothetical protein
MPDSIKIAVFIFGAILFLIGLLGGGFKLFGAEVSGKAGPGIRLLAAVFGLSLVIFGLHDQVPTLSELISPSKQGTDHQEESNGATRNEPEEQATADDGVSVPVAKVPCDSSGAFIGNSAGEKFSKTAKISSGAFVDYRGDINIAEVAFDYDKGSYPNPVYIRISAFQTNNRVAEGFAHTLTSEGVARVEVKTIVRDKTESDRIEVALCSEGRLVTNRKFKTRVTWLP